MPPTTASVEVPETVRAAEQTSAEKNERLRQCENEKKFVIKLIIPIPA